jgi:hypothetical protein
MTATARIGKLQIGHTRTLASQLSITISKQQEELCDFVHICDDGIRLARASEFEPTAIPEDVRKDYGETRYRGFGHIGSKACALAFMNSNASLQMPPKRCCRQRPLIDGNSVVQHASFSGRGSLPRPPPAPQL